MRNMSYCAFENTYSDLRECLNMLYAAHEQGQGLEEFVRSRSSRHEARAVEQLLATAEELIEVMQQMMDKEDVCGG